MNDEPDYDTSKVTFADCARCFFFGHDVRSWGTLFGWCRRCKYSVSTRDRRTVLSYGHLFRFPPAHRRRETTRAKETG